MCISWEALTGVIYSFICLLCKYRPKVGGTHGLVALAVLILLVAVWESSSDDLTQVATPVLSLETPGPR